jgi:flagellin
VAAEVHRNLGLSTGRLAVAMQRLSSGLRINSAADDAAGLGISEKLRSQIRSVEQANRNIQDGISLLNTMEAALDSVSSILQRARELAVQFNNGTNDWNAKQAIGAELVQLSNEVARIEGSTQFNGIPLLQDATAMVTLQVGANQGDTITVSLVDLFGPGLNLVRPISFFTLPWLPADIAGLDAHISDVAAARGRIGAQSNRLEYTMDANSTLQSNLMEAESRIRDVDVAEEMTQLVRQRVLQSTGMAMLQKFNQRPSASRVLDLLGGD